MTGSNAASTAGQEGRNLLLRIAASLVLAPLAVAAAYVGGWLWTSLVTVATIGLYVEWLTVIGACRLPLVLPGVVVLLGTGWVEAEHFDVARVSLLLGLGMVAVAIFSRERHGWAVAGIGYALATIVVGALASVAGIAAAAALARRKGARS